MPTVFMPSRPWDLYEAEAPEPGTLGRVMVYVIFGILFLGIAVSSLLGA